MSNQCMTIQDKLYFGTGVVDENTGNIIIDQPDSWYFKPEYNTTTSKTELKIYYIDSSSTHILTYAFIPPQ